MTDSEKIAAIKDLLTAFWESEPSSDSDQKGYYYAMLIAIDCVACKEGKE